MDLVTASVCKKLAIKTLLWLSSLKVTDDNYTVHWKWIEEYALKGVISIRHENKTILYPNPVYLKINMTIKLSFQY